MDFAYRVLWILKALVNRFVLKPSIFEKIATTTKISGCPQKFYNMFMYIAPSSGEPWPNLVCLLNGFYGGLRLFSDVWSENAALFKRLIEIHSNPPILYNGFQIMGKIMNFILPVIDKKIMYNYIHPLKYDKTTPWLVYASFFLFFFVF